MIEYVNIKTPPGQKFDDLFVGGVRVDTDGLVCVPTGIAIGYVSRGWIAASDADQEKIDAYFGKYLDFEASEPSKPALNVETLVPDHDTEPDNFGGDD